MTDTNTASTEGTTTTTEEAVKPKVKRIRKTATKVETPAADAPKAVKPKPAPKAAAAPKAEKPTRPLYSFDTTGQGQSTALNARVSRTSIDHSRFGSGVDWPLSERDQRSVEMLRKEFGNKSFKRENLDAGIIRRLGERGCISYVDGTHADSTYRLTNKGLGKPEPRAKKAA